MGLVLSSARLAHPAVMGSRDAGRVCAGLAATLARLGITYDRSGHRGSSYGRSPVGIECVGEARHASERPNPSGTYRHCQHDPSRRYHREDQTADPQPSRYHASGRDSRVQSPMSQVKRAEP